MVNVTIQIHHDTGKRTITEESHVDRVVDFEGYDSVRVYYNDESYDDYYHATITNIFFE